MLTSQLFEQWNIDTDLAIKTVQQAVGPCDIFLGGSLADDLGNEASDVDLFAFIPEGTSGSHTQLILQCGGATLDVTVVGGDAAPGARENLKTLLLAKADISEAEVPLLSPRVFKQLHALYRDRSLAKSSTSETIRQRYAADLLHVYLAVRSILACAALADDLIASPDQDPKAALYSARIAAEYAIDAALASEGLLTSNPKLRHSLLDRARLANDLPDDSLAHVGLFPDPSTGRLAVSKCLESALAFLNYAGEGHMVSRFTLVQHAISLVQEGHKVWSPS
ncbi:nucleotidyltransferase domain-containing protein [Streptomyces sp. CNS654]|uniref:nucleotidyltransferase domain-containing protein n=1 Tax=Streptomyces sp. CNS654 TaxID=1506995 RepID=UPI0005173A00|nr:nucleotidyltransferase domain-containing protein [Streptomyces sp. CNS654]